MGSLVQLKSRRQKLAVPVAVLLILAASAFVWTTRSSAEGEQAEIQSLVRSFREAQAREASIPANALAIVSERLDALAEGQHQPVDGDTSPVAILPEDLSTAIDRAYEARLTSYCSQAYQKRHRDDPSLSGVIEAGLYNHPTAPIPVEQQYELLAAMVMKNASGVAIVWTYSWTGDVLSDGKGNQNWQVEEYRVVKEDGSWRVDGRRSLVVAFAADDGATEVTWGPLSPHSSIVYGQQESASELYPDQPVPSSELQRLEDEALAH